MNIKRLIGIAIVIFAFVIGCSGAYGKISKQSGTGDKVTLTELRENWDDYDVYYSMRSGRWASAIMFDPNNNGTKLAGDSWIKIEDHETLNSKIKEIQGQYDYASVNIIEGPNNQLFGYMYYPSYLHLPVKVTDERTLYVMSLPPYKSAPGR